MMSKNIPDETSALEATTQKLVDDFGSLQDVLCIYAGDGDIEGVKYCLGKGAKLNRRDEIGHTPFLSAAWGGETEMVEYLHNAEKAQKGKANVDQRDREGSTGLMLAAYEGHLSTVVKLIELGADIEAQQRETKSTPLFFAIWSGEIEVVEELLKKGVNVNKQNVNLQTPLMLAADQGHAEICALLLKHGANINLINTNGETALDIAGKSGNAEIAWVLTARASDTAAIKDGEDFFQQTYMGMLLPPPCYDVSSRRPARPDPMFIPIELTKKFGIA